MCSVTLWWLLTSFCLDPMVVLLLCVAGCSKWVFALPTVPCWALTIGEARENLEGWRKGGLAPSCSLSLSTQQWFFTLPVTKCQGDCCSTLRFLFAHFPYYHYQPYCKLRHVRLTCVFLQGNVPAPYGSSSNPLHFNNPSVFLFPLTPKKVLASCTYYLGDAFVSMFALSVSYKQLKIT